MIVFSTSLRQEAGWNSFAAHVISCEMDKPCSICLFLRNGKKKSPLLTFTNRTAAFTFPPPSPGLFSVKHLSSPLPRASSPCFHRRLHTVPPSPFGEVMSGTEHWGCMLNHFYLLLFASSWVFLRASQCCCLGVGPSQASVPQGCPCLSVGCLLVSPVMSPALSPSMFS